MFKNYFKIAWRNLWRNKGLSFINIFGLAIGMAFAMLIGLWIQYEISFDSFHKNRDRIALVQKHTLFNDNRNTQESTPLPLYYELKDNYPEVKKVTRSTWTDKHSIVIGNHKFNKTGRFVDPDFLEMFFISPGERYYSYSVERSQLHRNHRVAGNHFIWHRKPNRQNNKNR
jgi:putative ABC transport system permease protein